MPSWLAYILILIMTVGISLGLKGRSTQIMSRANKNLIPKQITVSNITNEAATLHFITKDRAKTYISLSTLNNPPLIKFDWRDQTQQTPKQLHYFQLNQLKPNTQYQIEIYVEGKRYDQLVQFKTLHYQYPTLNNAPIFGKVVKSDLTASDNTLVEAKLTPKSKYSYSTLTKPTGEWIITLPFVLDENQQELKLDPEQKIIIQFTSEQLKKSTVLTKYNLSQPLRSVVLGQNYDFTKADLVLGVQKRQTNRLITAPANHSAISSAYPAFRGQAAKNSLVKVVIEPNIANLLISTNDSGFWQYVPLQPLPIGQYRLIAKQGDSEETIEFQITKSGEAILGEATPSANLTITPSQTPTQPPPQLTLTPLPSPTIQVIVPTTSLITPTITQEQIPQLGYHNNLLILLASGLSLLGLFLVLY